MAHPKYTREERNALRKLNGEGERSNRRHEAKARQIERNRRTNAEQLFKLIVEGHGFCREAQRLYGKNTPSILAELKVMTTAYTAIGDEVQNLLDFWSYEEEDAMIRQLWKKG